MSHSHAAWTHSHDSCWRDERAALPYDRTAGLIVTGGTLFHQVGASLAGGSILIARTTAATDGADQLAAFDQRPAAGRGDKRRIERRHVGMASLEGVVESARLTTVARCSAGFALGDVDRGELRAIHAREVDEVAVGIDNGDVQLPAMFGGLGLNRGNQLLRSLQADRSTVRNIER